MQGDKISWFTKVGYSLYLISILFAVNAHASVATNTKIKTIAALNADAWFIYVDTAPTGTMPTCATATKNGWRYVVKTSTHSGKALIASLMVAFAQNKTLSVYARGNFPNYTAAQLCDTWADTETIEYVDIQR